MNVRGYGHVVAAFAISVSAVAGSSAGIAHAQGHPVRPGACTVNIASATPAGTLYRLASGQLLSLASAQILCLDGTVYIELRDQKDR